jgi:type IV pilus assembly protein PilM
MANAGLGVTIGSHSLKAVAVRKKGEAFVVTKVVGQRFDAEALRDDAGRVLAAKGVRGIPATLGLSGRDVIIRYSQVPPVPDWRLRNLMKFEVDEVSGQSGGAVSADYRKLNLPDPDGARGEDTVLVALARNAYLDPLVASLKAGGIAFRAGCPNSVGLFDAFAINATYTEDETSLLVNVGAQGMDVAIQRGGELIFARNVSPGGKAFTDAIATAFSTTEAKAEAMKIAKADVTPRGQARYPDPTAEKVANAIMGVAGQLAQVLQSTLMICRAQTKLPDLKVDRVLLAGGGASLKGLDAYLKQAMGVPVERFDPFATCDVSGLPADEAEALAAAPHEFATALGLAQSSLAPGAFAIEVMPESMRRAREFATKGVFSIAAAVVAVGALAILYVGREAAAKEVSAQGVALNRTETIAQQRDSEFQKVLSQAQEEREKHRRLAERAAPGVLFSDAMRLLHERMPQEVYLDTVTLQVTDKTSSYDLMHPTAGAGRGGYQVVSHTHTVRTPVVVVVGKISASNNQAQIFNDLINRLKGNDLGLLVRTTKVLSGNEFTIEIAGAVALRPLAKDGTTEGGTPYVLRQPVLEEGDESVKGLSADGVVIVVKKDQVSAEDWKTLLSYDVKKPETPPPPPAPDDGSTMEGK